MEEKKKQSNDQLRRTSPKITIVGDPANVSFINGPLRKMYPETERSISAGWNKVAEIVRKAHERKQKRNG